MVDCYEAIPMREEAALQHERAEDLRGYVEKLDAINIAGNAGEINKQAFSENCRNYQG